MKTSSKLLLAVTATCIPLAGFAGTATAAKRPNSAPSLTALYNAARSNGETEVVVYHPFPAVNIASFQAFERRFPGIRVRSIALAGLPLRARIVAERRANRVGADLCWCTFTDLVPIHRKDVLTPFYPAAGLRSRYYGPGYLWANPTYTVAVPQYNTDQVKGGDIPDRWTDFTNPKWRGKIATGDIRSASSSQTFMLAHLYLRKVINDRILRGLRANNLVSYPSSGAVVNSVISGQNALNLSGAYVTLKIQQERGAHIEQARLKDMMSGSLTPLAVLKGARNPNAAKLMEAWTFSIESQRVFQAAGAGTVNPRVPVAAGLRYPKVDFLDYKEYAREMPRAIAHIQRIMVG